MVRFWIIGIVIVIAFILFALIDAAMSDPKRVRGVSKPIWVILIVLLPLAGAVLWFTVGKARRKETKRVAPDDDPSFTGRGPLNAASEAEMDARLKDLEEQLKALDEETFPGEEDGKASGEEKPDGDQGEPR